ncbi:DUF2982 domain-containing protein [Shewanella salipaludis]|uniref:DUF2982 domain-containing protein n=1 Tax=Shewanella salipaludis TaxID=2723052 RepID=A0A972FWH0_9GAMM|nr:DUF2982 domain-containing protein [Shewanella salipaludis]
MKCESDIFAVRPFSKRNGLTLSVGGGVSLLLGLSLLLVYPGLFAAGLLLFSLGAVGLLLGLAKLYEPETSMELTPSGLNYYHRRGSVFVAWDNIHRVDVPRLTQGMELIELPYVGIKLKRLNPVLDNISPRLATGLLTEQRPLLMTAATQDEDLQSLEHYLGAEFTPLLVEGDRYRGVLAMFGHRCQTLNAHLGYHLYIPKDSLDRDSAEFVRLLRQRIAAFSPAAPGKP